MKKKRVRKLDGFTGLADCSVCKGTGQYVFRGIGSGCVTCRGTGRVTITKAQYRAARRCR